MENKVGRPREYKDEDISFKGRGIRLYSRTVRTHSTDAKTGSRTGMLSMPPRFIGKQFDIILIQKETTVETQQVEKIIDGK